MRIGVALIISCILLVLFAGCVSEEPTSPQAATAEGLRSYVEAAADYARGVEPATAVAVFNDPESPLISGDWYIYAYDYEGTLLAHPYEREFVGTNRLDWTSANGLEVVRLGRDTAAKGGGYILYMYPSPVPGQEINESAMSIYHLKLGYVTPVDNEWWIGSGLYLSDMEGEKILESVDELVMLVDDAVDYAHTNGTSAALSAFSTGNNRFSENGHYIFALDYNGTLLAYRVDPGRVGESDLGVVRAYGVKSADAAIDAARSGGGFVVYSIKNPVTGEVEQKLSYVRPVDDTWWLGSGVYLSELLSA
jgi:two-component system NarL family sensor kinase